MSVVAVLSLFCDLCGTWTGQETHLTATQLRAQAHKTGWRQIRKDGQHKDVCRQCHPSNVAGALA